MSEAFLLSFFFTLLDMAAAVTELIVTDAVVVKAGQDIVHCGFRDVAQRLLCQESLMGRSEEHTSELQSRE